MWSQMRDLTRSLKPVHYRHLKIQDHHIRTELDDLFDRDLSVFCLTADIAGSVLLNTLAHVTANSFIIVDDQNFVIHTLSNALAGSWPHYIERKTDGNNEG